MAEPRLLSLHSSKLQPFDELLTALSLCQQQPHLALRTLINGIMLPWGDQRHCTRQSTTASAVPAALSFQLASSSRASVRRMSLLASISASAAPALSTASMATVAPSPPATAPTPSPPTPTTAAAPSPPIPSIKPMSGATSAGCSSNGSMLITFACVTRKGHAPGYKNDNQDSMFVYETFAAPARCLMGCFDGHGQVGHKVSGFIRDQLPSVLKRRLLEGPLPEDALHAAFAAVNERMETAPEDRAKAGAGCAGCGGQCGGCKPACGFDAYNSGSTAVVSLLDGDVLTTAWAGDSRAVLGVERPPGSRPVALPSMQPSQQASPLASFFAARRAVVVAVATSAVTSAAAVAGGSALSASAQGVAVEKQPAAAPAPTTNSKLIEPCSSGAGSGGIGAQGKEGKAGGAEAGTSSGGAKVAGKADSPDASDSSSSGGAPKASKASSMETEGSSGGSAKSSSSPAAMSLSTPSPLSGSSGSSNSTGTGKSSNSIPAATAAAAPPSSAPPSSSNSKSSGSPAMATAPPSPPSPSTASSLSSSLSSAASSTSSSSSPSSVATASATASSLALAPAPTWQAIELTKDHKPDRPDERRRVMLYGGRVARSHTSSGQPSGPFRVWLQDYDYPGLAMSRAMGDLAARPAGIICTPDVSQIVLPSGPRGATGSSGPGAKPARCFVVLASDGVWEFMSNKEVVDMVGARLAWQYERQQYKGGPADKGAKAAGGVAGFLEGLWGHKEDLGATETSSGKAATAAASSSRPFWASWFGHGRGGEEPAPARVSTALAAAAKAVADEATARWVKEYGGQYIDDITLVVAQLEPLPAQAQAGAGRD